MDELQLQYDFLSLLESMEMADHVRTAIVEAFHMTHWLDNTPLSDEEVSIVLDRLEQNNKRAGVPFDREWTIRDIKKRPGKYRATLKASRPMDMKLAMANSMRDTLSPRDARQAYYNAAVDAVKKMYKENGDIPFDDIGYRKMIKRVDFTKTHKDFNRANAQRIRFSDINEVMSDPVVRQLKIENYAFAQMLREAYSFLEGLEKAKADGTEGLYITKMRIKRQNVTAPEVKDRLRMTGLEGEDAENFAAKELAEKTSKEMERNKVHKEADSISRLSEIYPGVDYKTLYERFAATATPEEMRNVPTPTDTIKSYLSSAEKDPGESLPEFLDGLKRNMNVAFKGYSAENSLNNMMDDPKFSRIYPEVKEASSRAFIKPSDKPLYELWKGLSLMNKY